MNDFSGMGQHVDELLVGERPGQSQTFAKNILLHRQYFKALYL